MKKCNLSEEEAMELLAEIGVVSDGIDKLQWSVVYNMDDLNGKIFAHRKKDQPFDFDLKSTR